METIAILWLAFKEWFAGTFGSGVHFDGVPSGDEGYTEDEK